jgi:hypothetical protein
MSNFRDGFKLGWLAAAIEYEGSVGIHVLKNKSQLHGYSFHPYVSVYNTDKRLIQKVLEFADFGNINIERSNNPVHKDKVTFELRSRNGVLRFLEMIEPYLISKKERAQLVMQFCRSRISVMKQKSFRNPRKGSTPYSNEEIKLVKKVRKLTIERSLSPHQYQNTL